MNHSPRNKPLSWLAALLLMSSAGGMMAATLNWVGNTDANLGTAANWSPAQAPAAGDVLVFEVEGTSGSALVNNLAVTLDSLIVLSNDVNTVLARRHWKQCGFPEAIAARCSFGLHLERPKRRIPFFPLLSPPSCDSVL